MITSWKVNSKNYKSLFSTNSMLTVEIDKKKKHNPWDYDNFTEFFLKNNYKVQFSNKLILNDVIEKKN